MQVWCLHYNAALQRSSSFLETTDVYLYLGGQLKVSFSRKSCKKSEENAMFHAISIQHREIFSLKCT